MESVMASKNLARKRQQKPNTKLTLTPMLSMMKPTPKPTSVHIAPCIP